MQNYGSSMIGSFVVERVQILPDWIDSDIGRLLYDYTTNNYYLGAINNITGSNGWIPIGLMTNSVKSYHIDWDTNLSNRYGAISAKDIPVDYNNSITDVQSAFDSIFNDFEKLRKGDFSMLGKESITCLHLLKNGSNAVTSECIPITDSKSLFNLPTAPFVSVEDALNHLQGRRANDILLEDSDRSDLFGKKLNFVNVKTIQDALEALEKYLKTLTALDIPCTYEGCSCTTNVQFVLDALYRAYTDLRFTNLIDVPLKHDPVCKYLKSDGSSLIWVQLKASDIICNYPIVDEVSVQYALWDLKSRCEALESAASGLNLCAPDICFDDSSISYSCSTVGSALNIIFNNFYSPINKPHAEDVRCTAIGSVDNVNVQLVLSYLNSQINTILGYLPCNVNANDVAFVSSYGSSTVSAALTYILNFIDSIRGSYPKFNP